MYNLTKMFFGAGLAILLASCSSYSGTYGNNGRIYHAPDGRVYRQGEIYRAPNGDVYQNGVLIRRGEPTVVIIDNRAPQNLPPGQMKKVYGQKSAKVFAPGQQKKYNNGYYDDHKSKKYKKVKKHHNRYDD